MNLRAINRARGVTLVERGKIAATAWERLKGLLGRASLARGDGLLLQGEQAIHTMGMKIAIDVLFLDKRARVVRIVHSMPPARVTPFVFQSANVLELPAGLAKETGTQLGDEIEIQIGNP